MPIYPYRCPKCGRDTELIQQMGALPPVCCESFMERIPTFPGLVKIKGEGGYPSRRKFVKGTSPYTTRNSKAWLDSDPYESTRKANHDWS